jgi:hypothetical protein
MNGTTQEKTMNGTKPFGIARLAAAALLAAGVATATAGAARAADLWLHVDVHGDKGGDEAKINLPVSMIHNLAGMIPEETRSHGRIHVKDRDYDVAELRRAWREVQQGPDATYLTVNDPQSKVRIAKRGGYLELRATDRGGKAENVEAKIPLSVMAALLSGSGDQLNVDAALDELARFGEGELLTVTSDQETVRIWVDHASEGR